VIQDLGEPCVALLPSLSHVTVDHDALGRLADRIQGSPLPVPTWEHPAMPDAPGPTLDAVVWLANALNFCYWVPPGQRMWAVPVAGRPEVDAIGLLGALTGAARDGFDLGDGAWLAREDAGGPASIFARGDGHLPLRAERVGILNELGRVLLARFDGRLEHAQEAAGHDAVGLARFLMDRVPSFRDERVYRGQRLVFAKRAQLCAAMLHLRRRSLGAPGLRGTEHLTAFADYMLPRALRERGVLRYGPALAAGVDARRVLPAHSPEETEIRVATVGVCELLLGELRAGGLAVDALILDHWLWREGQAASAPHHRVLTTDY